MVCFSEGLVSEGEESLLPLLSISIPMFKKKTCCKPTPLYSVIDTLESFPNVFATPLPSYEIKSGHLHLGYNTFKR